MNKDVKKMYCRYSESGQHKAIRKELQACVKMLANQCEIISYIKKYRVDGFEDLKSAYSYADIYQNTKTAPALDDSINKAFFELLAKKIVLKNVDTLLENVEVVHFSESVSTATIYAHIEDLTSISEVMRLSGSLNFGLDGVKRVKNSEHKKDGLVFRFSTHKHNFKNSKMSQNSPDANSTNTDTVSLVRNFGAVELLSIVESSPYLYEMMHSNKMFECSLDLIEYKLNCFSNGQELTEEDKFNLVMWYFRLCISSNVPEDVSVRKATLPKIKAAIGYFA